MWVAFTLIRLGRYQRFVWNFKVCYYDCSFQEFLTFQDLEDFIAQGGKEGFILFSMGSAIPGSKMPEAKRKLFLNVFSKLKQQVLWKWESETMPDLPKNVKLSKWLPQQDLLGHKSIRMFVTHCGGGR